MCARFLAFSVLLMALFLISLQREEDSSNEDDYYFDLIVHIQEFYQARSIFLLHRISYEGDMESTNFIYHWIRRLSHHKILTSNIFFEKARNITFYYDRIVRPLFVVLIFGDESFDHFRDLTKSFDMDFPAWLVFFVSSSEMMGAEYIYHCRNPVGNIFNVTFSTEMIVVCESDSVLYEWYSCQYNETKRNAIAEWGPRGFKFLTELGLFDRRNDMCNTTLRAIAMTGRTSFILNQHYLGTLFGEILKEIAIKMNFTIEIVGSATSNGNYVTETDSWGGAMGALLEKNADIVVSEMSITRRRLDAVDFTIPLMISTNGLYIKDVSVFGVSWNGYFQVFSKEIWISIFLFFTITLLLTTAISKSYYPDRSWKRLLMDNYTYSFGILCQQGLPEFPRHSPLRLAFFSLLATSLVLYAAYSTSLMSHLTVKLSSMPFVTLEGFLRDGSYELLITRNTSDYDFIVYSNERLGMRMKSLLKPIYELPYNTTHALHQVCAHSKLAHYAMSELGDPAATQVPCKIVKIDSGQVENLAFALRKHSPYTKPLNHHLYKFLNNGMMKRYKNMMYQRASTPIDDFKKVTLKNITPTLVLFAAGVVLALFIMFVERTRFYLQNDIYR